MGQNNRVPQWKTVTDRDTPEIQALWEQCFEDSHAFVEWYFREYYQPENTLAVYDGDKPVSSAQLIPYRLAWENGVLPVRYIVGVDTHPSYRKRGYAKALLEGSLMQMRDRGIGLSLLMPFDAAFYRRYGWEYGYYHEVIACKASVLRPDENAETNDKLHILTAEEAAEAIPALMQIYNRFTESLQGQALRDGKKWRQILTDLTLDNGAVYLYEDENATPEGYCFRVIKKDGTVLYSEVAMQTGLISNAFLVAIGAQEDPAAEVEIHLAEGISVSEYANATIKKEPFMMVRVADVASLMSQLHYRDGNCGFRMGVTDGFAKWNTGIYEVRPENGVATITKVSDAAVTANTSENNPRDFDITAEALGQLITGGKTITELMQTGVLQIYTERALPILKGLQPKKPLFFNEYY